MRMELAFLPATARLGKMPAPALPRPVGRADAQVKARIRRELGDPHVDVLWRMTTQPWARARTAVVRPDSTRLREFIEGLIVMASTVGMSVVAAICIAQL